MAKRDSSCNEKTNVSLINQDIQQFDLLCTPLPDSPLKNPGPTKKQRKEKEPDVMDGHDASTRQAELGPEPPEDISNGDILKAVLALTERFSSLEKNLADNTKAIAEVCVQLGLIDTRVQKNEERIKVMEEKISVVQNGVQEAERYSRRWNLRLHGMKEWAGENIRMEVFQLFALIAPEDKERLGFLVDTVHRVRVRSEGKTRPVIIQFTMRYFRDKIWKIARDNELLVQRKLTVKEDLSYADRQQRKKLWPLVEAARSAGKKAGYRGPDAYIDGKLVVVPTDASVPGARASGAEAAPGEVTED